MIDELMQGKLEKWTGEAPVNSRLGYFYLSVRYIKRPQEGAFGAMLDMVWR